ncbi:hypothetical protein AB0I94_11675 [Streptomyces sp. NPDC050147]|uniref:hypothetical protein n=1 Tax=Streptomyces sp. NPDC050147 TaxID=3155513 RepID=UPI00343121B8
MAHRLLVGLLARLLARLLVRLLPGTGARRAPVTTEVLPLRLTAARTDPRPRSPYAREVAEDRPIEVSAIPLTRPYCRAA